MAIKKKARTKPIGVRFDTDTLAAIDKLATEDRRPRSSFIEKICLDYVKEHLKGSKK